MGTPEALLGTPLSVAVKTATEWIERARQKEAGTAERCAAYIEAAYAAVHGLEAEYDDIVSSAATLDPVNASQRQSLLTRIDSFLTQDNLRPELVRAAEGLKEARDSLRRNSAGFLKSLKPGSSEQKREVVRRVTELLDNAVNYLNGLTPLLDERYLRARENPSAPELPALLELERCLRNFDILEVRQASQHLREQVAYMREHREKGQFLYVAGEVGATAEQLRSTFG
jgi:hypothetical protein